MPAVFSTLTYSLSSTVRVAANAACNAEEAGAATKAQREIYPEPLLNPRRHRPVPVQRRGLHAAATGSAAAAKSAAASLPPETAAAVHAVHGPQPGLGAPKAAAARRPLAENVLAVCRYTGTNAYA